MERGSGRDGEIMWFMAAALIYYCSDIVSYCVCAPVRKEHKT